MIIKPYEQRESIWKYLVDKEANLEWAKSSASIPIPHFIAEKPEKRTPWALLALLKELRP